MKFYQRGPNLEVDFRYTNFFLASDPPPPRYSINQPLSKGLIPTPLPPARGGQKPSPPVWYGVALMQWHTLSPRVSDGPNNVRYAMQQAGILLLRIARSCAQSMPSSCPKRYTA